MRRTTKRVLRSDRLSGGEGADTFVVRNLVGTTTVMDLDGAEGDRLDVSEFGFADFTAFNAGASPDGPGGHDTRLDPDADTVVILQDVSPAILDASHVVLV